MDWDDLKYVLAVARAGSLSGAARMLDVNHSTVFRRLGAIEERLDVRLFERLQQGYVPTDEGLAMAQVAETVEDKIAELSRRVEGAEKKLAGTIRVTTVDTFANGLLLPHFIAFREQYPGIELELHVSSDNVNLTRRDADVAIRPTSEPPEELVGRKLCQIGFAIYGHENYLQRAGQQPLGEYDWVGVDDSLRHIALARWFREHYPDTRPALRCNTIAAKVAAVQMGAGIGVLPCYMGDGAPGMRRLSKRLPLQNHGLWQLTHVDLRHNARIQAFMRFMQERIEAQREMIEGSTQRP